jgi:hypothetical protein
MPEINDPALLAPRPGAWLTASEAAQPRATVLAAEIAKLDRLVAGQAETLMELFDEPMRFTNALKSLA